MNRSILLDIVSKVRDVKNISILYSELAEYHKYSAISTKEKLLLMLICKNLNNDSVVVEVGSYLGGSASIMAHANSNCNIYCFDDFNPTYKIFVNHTIFIKEMFGENQIRTKENLENFYQKYKNINFVKVKDKNSVGGDLDLPIDFYFEDGNHKDSVCSSNIEFWSKKLKKYGIMVIHDYKPNVLKGPQNYISLSDVPNAVEKLKTNHLFDFIDVIDSSAIFQKN